MGSFRLFLDFPLELQDQIWEQAIPTIPAAGAVYCTQLVRLAKYTDEDGCLDLTNPKDRVHLFRTTGPRTPLERTLAALSALLVTCRRSSAAALDAYARLRYPNPFPLRRKGLLDLQINASSDLVILHHGWQDPCRLITSVSLTRMQVPPRLQHIGLAWPGRKHGRNAQERVRAFYYPPSLDGLLALWGSGLAALYVVVEPEDLEDMKRDNNMLAEGPEKPPERSSQAVSRGLWAHEADERDEAVFFCEGREYYELPGRLLGRCVGLENGFSLLENARLRCTPGQLLGMDGEEDDDQRPPPPRCRFLTWRPMP